MLYLFAVSLVHMTTLCVLYGECLYIVMIKIYLYAFQYFKKM